LIACILAMLLLFGLGVPVAIAMLAAALVYLWINPIDLIVIPQKLQAGADSFPLLAVPFFLYAGELMSRSGITRRLVDLALALVGHFRGALAQVNVVTNMLMAGVSGAATADAAATGSVLIPEMVRRGYSPGFSAAITGAAATIGPIIPPSITMVIYGSMANVSVGRLFVGGIIPGILMGLYLMVAAYLVALHRGYAPEAGFSWTNLGRVAFDAALPLLVPLVIVGGIVFGIFTPTEAGAIAVAIVLVLGIIVYRSLTFVELWAGTKQTLAVLGPVMFAVAAANVLGWMLAVEDAAGPLRGALLGISSNPIVILIVINAVLLVLGCFVEVLALLILMTPVLVPVILQLGIDPVHFGVVMVLTLTIGLVTPPVGLVAFVTSKIAGVTMLEFANPIYS